MQMDGHAIAQLLLDQPAETENVFSLILPVMMTIPGFIKHLIDVTDGNAVLPLVLT